MAHCSKCGGSKSQLLSDSFLIVEGDGAAATISFTLSRILTSAKTGGSVQVNPTEPVQVYMEDLYHWIQSGVRGIIFRDPVEEATFLTIYTDIRPYHYA